MRIHARTEYALRAVVDLAGGESSSTVGEIAERQHISTALLQEILTQLSGAGLVRSPCGTADGWRLVDPADEISVADVVVAVDRPVDRPVDGPVDGPVDVGGAPGTSLDTLPSSHALSSLWAALDQEIANFLDGVTIADLAADELPGWTRQLVGRDSGQLQASSTVGLGQHWP